MTRDAVTFWLLYVNNSRPTVLIVVLIERVYRYYVRFCYLSSFFLVLFYTSEMM